MIVQPRPQVFVAHCEDCDARSAETEDSRPLAIARLLLAGWRVRPSEDRAGALTWCPDCRPTPSVRPR